MISAATYFTATSYDIDTVAAARVRAHMGGGLAAVKMHGGRRYGSAERSARVIIVGPARR